MSRSHYIQSILAGFGIFGIAYLVEVGLMRAGLQGETTLLDDSLLGILAGLGLFFFLRHLEATRELRRRRHHELVIDDLNHHIRNALQLIVNRVEMEVHSVSELHDIRNAVNRIDWALREILPHVTATSRPGSAGYPKAPESAGFTVAAAPPGSLPGPAASAGLKPGAEPMAHPLHGAGSSPSEAGEEPDSKISVTK